MHDTQPSRRSLPRRPVLRGLAAGGALVAGGRPALAARRIAIGTYGGNGCTGVPEVAAYEKWLGRKLDLVLDFLDTSSWDKMLGDARWTAGCWKGAGRRQMALSVPMLVNEGKPTLQQGAAGAFDGHFRDLAGLLVGAGYPDCIIRIGWEFNGNWYAWSARPDPAAYAAYWRRIARAMRGQPGAHFRFDWTAATTDGPTDAAYPGDDVVDVIGLDVYNQSWPLIPVAALRWQYLLREANGLIWHRDFAHAHGKPRSFPEWGTGTRPDGHGGGDDPLFVRNMLDWMRTGDPVAYACYWNYRASDYDAKVTDGKLPAAAAALRQGLAHA